MNYYNEWDPQAAAWPRELIAERLIPRGLVDERSITEVEAGDLEGFTQCHFFAGIGGWPLALQLAGVSHRTPLWTGSPPCQPFSAAGKQLGQFDPRHLAPVFLDLIGQCRPPRLFGEQVAPAIGKSWMCDLQVHLEREGYAVGFAVLPACSVGAPHKRDRLIFGAHQLADPYSEQRDGERLHRPGEGNQTQRSPATAKPARRGDSGGVADPNSPGLERWERMRECTDEQSAWAGSLGCGVGDSNNERCDRKHTLLQRSGQENMSQAARAGENSYPDAHHRFWSDADWLGCRDGKFRPVEPGTFPLANGVPARVGRLRGYGNAIVPQVAAEFITAFMEAAGATFEV